VPLAPHVWLEARKIDGGTAAEAASPSEDGERRARSHHPVCATALAAVEARHDAEAATSRMWATVAYVILETWIEVTV